MTILQNKSKTHKTELGRLRDIPRNNTLTIQVMKWEMTFAPKRKQRRIIRRMPIIRRQSIRF